MGSNQSINHNTVQAERFQRAILVGTHQTVVADNIRRKDRSQLAFHDQTTRPQGVEDNPKIADRRGWAQPKGRRTCTVLPLL